MLKHYQNMQDSNYIDKLGRISTWWLGAVCSGRTVGNRFWRPAGSLGYGRMEKSRVTMYNGPISQSGWLEVRRANWEGWICSEAESTRADRMEVLSVESYIVCLCCFKFWVQKWEVSDGWTIPHGMYSTIRRSVSVGTCIVVVQH